MNFIFYIEICLCQQIVKRVESNNSIARSILYGYFTSNSLLRMARFMNAQRWSDMSNQFWALNHPTLKWKTSLACRRRRGNMLVLKNWLWTFFVVHFPAHSVVQQQRQKISSAHQKICDNIINIRSSEYEQTTTMHSTGKQQLGYWMSNRVFVQFLRVVILKAVWL